MEWAISLMTQDVGSAEQPDGSRDAVVVTTTRPGCLAPAVRTLAVPHVFFRLSRKVQFLGFLSLFEKDVESRIPTALYSGKSQ